MFVYVGKSYTATVRGSRIVPVTCERCQGRFFYELTRVGIGRASAPYYIGQASAADRAGDAAQKDLVRRLERESELVPCPDCQWVNEDMIARYRRRKNRIASWFAAAIVIVGTAAALGEMFVDNRRFPSGGMQVFLAVCLLFAAGLLLIRHWLRRRIAPNRNAPGRPVLPPGTPPALVERPDPFGGPSRLEPAPRQPDEPVHAVEWVVLRPNQGIFPGFCCICLAEATTAFDSPFKVDENSNLGVPLCGPCSSQLRNRWRVIAMISAGLALAFAGLVALTFPGGDTTGRWIAFVVLGLFASIFAVAVVPNMFCRPYRFGLVDADRGIARFSSRNPAYNALLEQRVREMDGIASKPGYSRDSDDFAGIPVPDRETVIKPPPSYPMTYGTPGGASPSGPLGKRPEGPGKNRT